MIAGKLNIKIKKKTFKQIDGFDNTFCIRKDGFTTLYTHLSNEKLKFIRTLTNDTKKQKPFKCECNDVTGYFYFESCDWDMRDGIIELKMRCINAN